MKNFSLSICLNTSRHKPMFSEFFASLAYQLKPEDDVEIIIVDFFADNAERQNMLIEAAGSLLLKVRHVTPMPSVWQGPHKLVKGEWFANSAARNTFLLYSTKKWILHLDDRCVLMPGFMDAVRENMNIPKVTFGRYEKRSNVKVENGRMVDLIGEDGRMAQLKPQTAPGNWYFGCCGLVPLNLMLQINGWDTTLDGLGMEDIVAGLQLANNPGVEFQYDHRMFMVEDRTPGECGPVMRREDAGVSPNDLSHKALAMLKDRKRALHYWTPDLDLKECRRCVQNGLPMPQYKIQTKHFWDGTELERWFV